MQVCGHWIWDNDNLASMVCRQLGYHSGELYTFGSTNHLPVRDSERLLDLTNASQKA
eukprot:COSAG04_NODE_519_length_13169_cov_10.968248_9_plen_57_part_00